MGVRAASLTTMEGRTLAGKISLATDSFVVTAADQAVARVPLADVQSVVFDRVATITKPAEWTGHSVGPAEVAGSFTHTNGDFTVVGAGRTYQVERGHFYVQQEVGEAAQLTTFVPRPPGTRGGPDRFKAAGVALLGRFDGTGPAAYLVLSDGGRTGVTRWRTAEGKERSKHFTPGADGMWLRLERCANEVTALASADGQVWQTLGSEVLALPEVVHAGLLVTGPKPEVPVALTFGRVELLTDSATPAALPQLQLRDGGVLAGRFVSADGSAVRWQALGREWLVSLVNISRLVLDARGSATTTRLSAGRVGAVLASGDFVDGELVGGGEGRVTISSVLFGLRNYSTEGAVLAVHVRDKTEAAAQFELVCADGSRLLANQLELRADGVAGREFNVGEFLLRPGELAEVRRTKR